MNHWLHRPGLHNVWMDAEGFGNDQKDCGQGDQECGEFNDPVIPFDDLQKMPPFFLDRRQRKNVQ